MRQLIEYAVVLPGGGTLTRSYVGLEQMRAPVNVADALSAETRARSDEHDNNINNILGIRHGNSNRNRVGTRVGFACLQFPSDFQRP